MLLCSSSNLLQHFPEAVLDVKENTLALPLLTHICNLDDMEAEEK